MLPEAVSNASYTLIKVALVKLVHHHMLRTIAEHVLVLDQLLAARVD
jgi:hypothetical protein